MIRPTFSFRTLVAAVCLTSACIPLTRLLAQCCSGASAAWETGSAGGGGNVSDFNETALRVTNPGTSPIKIEVAGIVIDVLAGETVIKRFSPGTGAPAYDSGEGLSISLRNENGGPPGPNEKAQVNWTFPPRKKKGNCKKKEHGPDSSDPTCETCGTSSTLSANIPKVDAQCDDEDPHSASGDSSNGSPSGGGEPTPADLKKGREVPSGDYNQIAQTGSLKNPASGSMPEVTPALMDISVPLGRNAGSTWSAGVLVADGPLESLNSYSVRGNSGVSLEKTFSPAPANSPANWNKAWVTATGLTVAHQVSLTSLRFTFYPPGTYTYNSNTQALSLNSAAPNHPNRGRLIEMLPITAPAPGSGETTTASSYRVTEESINPSNGEVLDSIATTTDLTTRTAGSVPVERTVITTIVQQGVTLSVHSLTTTYNLAQSQRTVAHREWTGPETSGIYHDYDEVFQLFPWGEEKVAHRVYPDGKTANAPVILSETAWWQDNASSPRYGTVKMNQETHGIWSGAAVTGGAVASWAARWIDPDPAPSNAGGTVQVEIGPWRDGPSVPGLGASHGALNALAVSGDDYDVSRTYSSAAGAWLGRTRHLGNIQVEASEDTDPSLFYDEVERKISASESVFSVTESPSGATGDFYLKPTKQWEIRVGSIDVANSDLVSRTYSFRQNGYLNGSDPTNPLVALTWGTADTLKWDITWSSTREFPDSDAATLPAYSTFIKTFSMTDRLSGLPVLERKYLSTNEVNPGADSNTLSDILLETKLWLYDAKSRLLAVKTSRTALSSVTDPEWTVMDEWSYTEDDTSLTTTHTDSMGVKTETVTDLLGRPITRTLFANGHANQSNIVTTWTYAPRPGKAGSIVTQSVSGGGAWVRTSSEETDGAGRLVASTDPAGMKLAYTFEYNSNSGQLTETIWHTNPNPDIAREIRVRHRNGQLISLGRDSVAPNTFTYSKGAYSTTTTRTEAGTATITVEDGLGRTVSEQRIVRDVFTETRLYDDQGRVRARSLPSVAGTLWEVHRWVSLDGGSVAHDTALSVNDSIYDNADTNRRRTISRYIQAAPPGSSTLVWWSEVEQQTATSDDVWESSAWSRSPLEDVKLTLNNQANFYPLSIINEGPYTSGIRTVTAEARNRGTRTFLKRSWKSGSQWRTITVVNGLPTTYTAPEHTAGATLYYTPLREPLAEATFESYPYWPRIAREPQTGRIIARYLPNRSAYSYPITTAIPLAQATEFYEYYPASHPSAGLLAKSAKPNPLAASPSIFSQSDATYYAYNGRGQLTHQWGPGTYPKRHLYDPLGRMTELHTWRSAAGTLDWSTAIWPTGADSSAHKSVTRWYYYGNSDLVEWKEYPGDGSGSNPYVESYYTAAGNLYWRYSQRGNYSVWTGRGYDAYGRLKVVDYSDSTPDALFTYNGHTGFLQTHAEGNSLSAPGYDVVHTGGFTATRTTSYTTRADGTVTAEILVDNGETITLERPHGNNGRQSGLKLTWGTLGTAPEQSYGYDNFGRLGTLTSVDTNGRSIWTNLSRSSTSRSVQISVQDGGTSYSSYTYDIHGRVSSENSDYDYSRALRWDRDRLVSRGRGTTADRWEYRYNSRGEVNQGWKQFGATVTTPTSGEVKAATGSIYRYDDIGNRTQSDEVGRGALIGNGTSVPTAIDTASASTSLRTTNYGKSIGSPNTANEMNQYKRIEHPAYFNVRGTRSTSGNPGSTIIVNGDTVDVPTPTADSGYQPSGTGTYFRDEVPNTTPSGTTMPDLFEPVKVTQNSSAFTMDDPVQYLPPPVETLTYDDDGNLLTDGRWTYTWDAADRLIRMESQPFQQPAVGVLPLVQVPGKKVEFAYDAFSRRIRKKVSDKAVGAGSWTLVSHEAYVYDDWNMIASYSLHLTGPNAGKGKERIASHVWGPDIGSNPTAGWDWQTAGGVGGLIMTLNPPAAADPNPPSYEDWLSYQGVYPSSGGYGYDTPFGWLNESELENYGWGYPQYSSQVFARYNVQIPTMDHMGNVISVVRLKCELANEVISQTEFVYDYDAFGKEIRSSALIAGSNPDSYPFHYSTKFTDAETGLVYYGYRFYDPVNGRWINRDPSGEDGGMNLYGIVSNDSIGTVDVLGLHGQLRGQTYPVGPPPNINSARNLVTGGQGTTSAPGFGAGYGAALPEFLDWAFDIEDPPVQLPAYDPNLPVLDVYDDDPPMVSKTGRIIRACLHWSPEAIFLISC